MIYTARYLSSIPSETVADNMGDSSPYSKLQVDANRRVYVYRNLHKNVWSVRQDGRVRCHALELCLEDAKFLVSPAGRARVLKSNAKNVHAGVSGYISHRWKWLNRPGYRNRIVTYHPQTYDHFYKIATNEKVTYSPMAYFETIHTYLYVTV